MYGLHEVSATKIKYYKVRMLVLVACSFSRLTRGIVCHVSYAHQTFNVRLDSSRCGFMASARAVNIFSFRCVNVGTHHTHIIHIYAHHAHIIR